MPEQDPVGDELRQLAELLATVDDEDVIESALVLVREYRAKIEVAFGMDAVDRMTQDDVTAVEDRLQRRVRKAKAELVHKLRNLVAWARESGKT